jgi:hypothetical protein
MGWVVDDMVHRVRRRYGHYRRREWRQFVRACGLTYGFDYLPDRCDAVIDGNEIVFRHDISEEDAANAAFHECWHWLADAGTAQWWLSRPQGRISMMKWDARANEFARVFPVCDDG